MTPTQQIDLSAPRSIGEIIDVAVTSHLRKPLLFLAMACSVVTPYVLIVLAVTGASPLGETTASTATIFILSVANFALVGPMISVLHIQALTLLGEGTDPTLRAVYGRALPVLAMAAAAQIVAGFGIAAGLLAFIVPGVVLLVRLAVVAQTAAIERLDWQKAVRGSFLLTTGQALHVLGAVLVAGVFDFALNEAGIAIAGSHTHVQQVILAIVIGTVGQSFAALVTAVLYYDLRARISA